VGQPTPSLAVRFCTVKALVRQESKKTACEARHFVVIFLLAHCIFERRSTFSFLDFNAQL
jgi:hypothetical protein